MAFNSPTRPITVDDTTLRAMVDGSDVPALLMTVAHLTGDTSILREEYRANGWLMTPQGGLSPEQQAGARADCLAALIAFRDQGSRAPGPPGPELLKTITTWAMGQDTEPLLPVLAEEIVLPGTDPKAPGWTREELDPGSDLTVAIIGAGLSGLVAAHRLAQAGIPFVIFEKNPEVGGTWWENTYPGCRVDVPSHLYSYSFAARTDWPEHFCTHSEVLDYIRSFAKEFDLYSHIRFDTEVVAATWDDQDAAWHLRVRTPDGVDGVKATVLVSAVGQLNRPALPEIPGRETFAGPAFHSARWDHGVDLSGKRVAVIGTGASAFQFVPEIAETTGELLVFQRTPPWLRPTPHYRDKVPDAAIWLSEHVPYYAAWYRFSLFAPGLQGAPWSVDPDYPASERAISELNDAFRETLTRAMEAQLADAPELRDRVIPQYPVGAKRVFRDDGSWLKTLKRNDVELISAGIEKITPRGVTTDDGVEHDVDVLVYGTGFQASRFLTPMTVTGRDGLDLHSHWDGDARAYLGMSVPGFPNLFCLYGPNTNLVGQGGSIIYFSECASTYLLDAVKLLVSTGKRAMEVRPEVHDEYNAWVDEASEQRAWSYSKVSSWFINAKGRSAQNWPFSALEYWRRTQRVEPSDFELS